MKAQITPEPAILGFLMTGPLHGYDLHKQLVANLGSVWRLGQSQMYAILKEYESKGFIKIAALPQDGRPARKMLELTPSGKRTFETWMNQTAHGLREFRVDFFVRLYFARAAGRPALHTFLTQQIRTTQAEYDALTRAEETSEFGQVVSSFRKAQLEAILAWLATCQAEASDSPKRQPKKKNLRKSK